MPLETPRTYVSLTLEPDEPRRPMPHRRLIVGIAALAVLGALGGFLVAPLIADEQPSKTILAPEAQVAAPSEALDIVVDETPPPVEPLMPPGPAGSSAAPVETPRPAPREVSPPPAQPAPKAPQPVRTEPAPSPPLREAPAPRVVATAPAPPYAAITREDAWRAGRTTRPSFNCRYARTVSERMVCVDPRLAAADRRLASAYHRAIGRGVPEPELRRQQDIWLGIRESAARQGPEGVARAYEERTAQLQAMGR